MKKPTSADAAGEGETRRVDWQRVATEAEKVVNSLVKAKAAIERSDTDEARTYLLTASQHYDALAGLLKK